MDVHPGLLKMVNKMVEEATSPDNENEYVNTRLKNDILVGNNSILLMIRNKYKNTKSKTDTMKCLWRK